MPNHIQNVVKISKIKNVEEVIKKITNEEGEFDFNKIIPMPKSLMIESSSRENSAITLALYEMSEEERKKAINELNIRTCFDCYNKKIDEKEIKKIKENVASNFKSNKEEKELGIKTLADLGRTYINNFIKYGCTTWYDWSVENWGTKWNAYEQDIVKGKSYIKLYFQTAWSCPLPIYRKMAEMLKTKIEIKYADEDIGNNCGEIIYDPDENGINENYNSREGDETFANRVWKM